MSNQPLADPREEMFAQRVAKGEEIGKAYEAVGFEPDGANASRFRKRPRVSDRIAFLMAEAARVSTIDAAWLLKRLADEATADLNDLYDMETGAIKPVDQWPLIWRQGLVSGVEVEELFVGGGRGKDRQAVGRVIKIKVSDRVKRLELIGRHVDIGAFKDKVEHSGSVNLIVSPDDANL